MAKPKRILVVESPECLLSLGRANSDQSHDWHLSFAASGGAGLNTLQNGHFDVVIVSAEMDDMSGEAFLDSATLNYPGTIRILISEDSELELTDHAAVKLS